MYVQVPVVEVVGSGSLSENPPARRRRSLSLDLTKIQADAAAEVLHEADDNPEQPENPESALRPLREECTSPAPADESAAESKKENVCIRAQQRANTFRYKSPIWTLYFTFIVTP